jgi:hypothetical protein
MMTDDNPVTMPLRRRRPSCSRRSPVLLAVTVLPAGAPCLGRLALAASCRAAGAPCLLAAGYCSAQAQGQGQGSSQQDMLMDSNEVLLTAIL